MASSHQHRFAGGFHLSRRNRSTTDGTLAAADSAAVTATSIRDIATATLRVVLGFVFLWAFLDKTFGLGYATKSGKAWIDGARPTEGFLSRVDVGPMAGTLRGWAGDPWADWLFMLGLLGIGIAVILGIGLRIAAVSGTVMMALMWIAEWPPAKHSESGAATMSTNPFADYHVIYALALIALAATAAGTRYGLGTWWSERPFVKKYAWLR
ncbi:DoxX family membrane protein [Yinghuangia soli]|uniref:DoxX family membrane protein n=1 Tax=Yinghuangia soli TaxID=2908204 RepID=A0AA41U4C6_9ACTN|nr:DoxX family membrane protein [Yinghuangia soli]MCF2528914.1 DoxX family membrane protein [Yinghuangia soli]